MIDTDELLNAPSKEVIFYKDEWDRIYNCAWTVLKEKNIYYAGKYHAQRRESF